MQDPSYMSERCCLTPLNENSHHINDLILQQLREPVHTYLSTDRVVTDDPDEAAAYPMEFLNAKTPSGLPKHNLELKVLPFMFLGLFAFPSFTYSLLNKLHAFICHINAPMYYFVNVSQPSGLIMTPFITFKDTEGHYRLLHLSPFFITTTHTYFSRQGTMVLCIFSYCVMTTCICSLCCCIIILRCFSHSDLSLFISIHSLS